MDAIKAAGKTMRAKLALGLLELGRITATNMEAYKAMMPADKWLSRLQMEMLLKNSDSLPESKAAAEKAAADEGNEKDPQCPRARFGIISGQWRKKVWPSSDIIQATEMEKTPRAPGPPSTHTASSRELSQVRGPSQAGRSESTSRGRVVGMFTGHPPLERSSH